MRKLVKGTLVMLLATLMVTTVLALVYWSRTIHHSLTVIGINAELLQNTGTSYLNKIVAVDVDSNGKVLLTIYSENFYNVWLNLTFTSDAVGLDIQCTGQYVEVQYNTGNYIIVPVGSPIPNFMGYHVIDKTQMMYKTPDTGVTGGALQLAFIFDTETVTMPGEYTADLLFQMGFV
jgi:hypothetical protein